MSECLRTYGPQIIRVPEPLSRNPGQNPDGAPWSTKCPFKTTPNVPKGADKMEHLVAPKCPLKKKEKKAHHPVRIRPESRGPQGALGGLILGSSSTEQANV